jgi:chitodextrinase
MTLRMDYDDGFVSYINGVEVTRANMPGGTPDHNTAASGGHKASKGTGALAEFDLVAYTGNLVTGTNVLTVEIHNQKIGDKTLTMIPELEILNTPEPDVTAPSTPANLAATAVSMTQIDLSWDASTDNVAVTGYNIYRDGGGTPIATVAGTTYQDTGLSQSTLYTYNVSAVDFNLNESAQSSQASDTTPADSTAPSTPANLTATSVLESQINLSWDASTDDVGVTDYNIYRDGGGTPIATVAGTTYQDTGLSALTLYTYNVSAEDAASNESAQSSQASDTTFTPDVTAPSTPANLTATAVSSSQIDLSWDASTDNVGVTGYNIYRDGGGTPITTVTGTTYQDTGLSPLTMYTYNVSAVDGASNESAQSSPDSDTTLDTTITVINIGDNWKYFKGYSNPAAGWTGISFDDSAWLVGPTGIGYGDGDDATVLNDMEDNYRTVYARKTFNVIDASYVTGMTLNVDYDDGFVAYINGQEVARASMPAGTPAYNTSANNHEAGTPETFDLSAHTGRLESGINVLVIEGHNGTIGSSDFSMIPELKIDN